MNVVGRERTIFGLRTGTIADLANTWYLALFRGVVAFLAALLALTLPISTATFLVSAYLVVDGVVAIALGVRIGSSPWIRSAFMLEGAAGALCAILILTLGSNALIFIVAIWAGVTGLLEIAAALALPSASWIIATLGIASLGFGAALFAWPAIGIRTFVDLMTSYTVLAAILFFSAALILRRLHLRRISA